MTLKNYIYLCLFIIVAWPLALLFVPGVSEAVQYMMIAFLSSTA